MLGKYDERLWKARVVVIIAALAVALAIYGFRHFFGS
jgi:cytochrome c-type biogenesis protein CcmE